MRKRRARRRAAPLLPGIGTEVLRQAIKELIADNGRASAVQAAAITACAEALQQQDAPVCCCEPQQRDLTQTPACQRLPARPRPDPVSGLQSLACCDRRRLVLDAIGPVGIVRSPDRLSASGCTTCGPCVLTEFIALPTYFARGPGNCATRGFSPRRRQDHLVVDDLPVIVRD